jgi:hypothetical protein
VLALKGNQSELQEMVSDFFTTAIEKNFDAVECSRTEDNDYGHGRIESRICYSVPLPDYLKALKKTGLI